MKKYIFSIAAVAAMFASCSQDSELDIVDNGPKAQVITTITASSNNGTTRAVVDGTSINWETGDQLSVFGTNSEKDGNNWAKPTAYTLDPSCDGSTTGEFTNPESTLTDVIGVMYPYQSDARFLNSEVHYNIPTVQTGVKGSFDKSAAIMYNVDGGTSLYLGVNFLRVNIGEGNVHSVTISSPTSQLSGRVVTNGSTYTIPDPNQIVKSVTLVAGPNTTDCFKAGTYYIAVKPGEIVTPTISYVYIFADEHAAEERYKTASGNLNFSADSNVKDISVTWGSNPNKRGAVQLWAGGPYIAEYNVGVTDGKAENYGGYYAWGGSQDKVDDHNTGAVALTGTDDTATKLWGSNWRMPTKAEFDDLLANANCDVDWTAVNGVNGRKFTGKVAYASNSVFLPAAGRCSSGNVINQGYYGYYWSSAPRSSNAYDLFFGSGHQYVNDGNRNGGYSVRAVLAQ